MRMKAMDPSGNAHTAKRLAPGNCLGLGTILDRQCVGAPGASSDDLIYLFLEVDERLFHNEASVGYWVAGRKQRDSSETGLHTIARPPYGAGRQGLAANR